MAVIEIAKIQVRRGQENLTGVPQLAPGEFGWAQDTENLYIGKRIAEGANTDENSRILTQKDYDNLFALAMGAGRTAVASTSTYRYRDDLDYINFQSTTTFVGTKLDATVSLTDFGLQVSSTATDVYQVFNLAVQNINANTSLGKDARRKIIVPAGIYYLSNTVDLPPYTHLVGEGQGLTTLLSLTNDKPLFRTVDANGVSFESNMASQQSAFSSRHVTIEGMTLAWTTSTSTIQPLVTFDNTENSTIHNVEFTIYETTNTTTGTILTYTATVYGSALSLRGERKSGVEQNKNVSISNCKFKNIGLGILATGTVAYSKIESCLFSELQQGINFSAFVGDLTGLAPSQSIITKNIFENIINQAIFIGTSTNQTTYPVNTLNHSSSFNSFYRVGNGLDLGDNITINTGTAIISNFGEGFISTGDIFSRKEIANPNLRPDVFTFFYKPILEGSGIIENDVPVGVESLTYGKAILDRIYVSDKTQSLSIPYTLSDGNNLYSRTGKITVTVNSNPDYSSTPFASVSDYYDYSYDSLWPVALDLGSIGPSGEVIQPVITTEPGDNNSYLNLIYLWPISPPPGVTTFIGTITNITNANPAVLTTQDSHGISSGTQVLLEGVEGLSNFFSSDGSKEYYAWVLTTNTFALYWDSALLTALDTTALGSFVYSTASVITIAADSQLSFQYQTKIIS